jgi:hypothetical protein
VIEIGEQDFEIFSKAFIGNKAVFAEKNLKSFCNTFSE